MHKTLAMIGNAFAALSHLIVSMGSIGLIGEVVPPQSLLD